MVFNTPCSAYKNFANWYATFIIIISQERSTEEKKELGQLLRDVQGLSLREYKFIYLNFEL